MERRTRTARIHLHERGHVHIKILADAVQSLDDARANLSAAIEATQGVRRPVLTDISDAVPLEPEVRHYYTGRKLAEAFTAMALVVDVSPVGRMMGNVYLRIANAGIPTQLFRQDGPAMDWLQDYLP